MVVTCTPGTFEAPAMEPVTRFFEFAGIEPFTRDETELAIRLPLEHLREKIGIRLDLDFDEDYVDELMKWSKGYPYFVKFITCQLVLGFEMVRGRHLSEYMQELIDAMGRAKFERDFASATDRGQRILIQMASKPMDKYEAEEFKKIPQYPYYLKELHDKGLLSRNRRGVYSVYHPLFLEWIKRFILKMRERVIVMPEWTIPVSILLAGMIFNWYLHRSGFKAVARMSEEGERRLAEFLKGMAEREKKAS